MLINGRKFPRKGCNLICGGCSCHNTANSRRKVKKSAKRAEERDWKKDQCNY